MRHLPLFLITLFAISCSPKEEAYNHEADILMIENGLRLGLEIQGDTTVKYNIDARLKQLGIPGLSIAVVKDGKLAWAKGYGMADSASNRKVDANTLFLAASISKPITALRLHQLAEQGVVDLDSNINDYLTSWKVPENEFTKNEKVTIRRILNHTAGLTVWGFRGYLKGDTIPSLVEVLNGQGNSDSVYVYKEPGESWRYSGGGYTILQLMLEDLENESFPVIMKKHVLSPMGMNASTFINPLPDKFHGIAATGYRRNGDEVEGKWPIYPEIAAAGLWTTPSDLVQYGAVIGSINRSSQDGFLKSSTVKEMLTPGMEGHGLGPAIEEFTFGHGGADEGFRCQLVVWKDSAYAVVVMVNSDNGSINQEVLRAFADVYQLPGFEPDVKVVANLSAGLRENFAGTYNMYNHGESTIAVKGKGLEAKGGWFGESVLLLPENDSIFFNTTSGTQYTFTFDQGIVKGFKVGSRFAEKMD